MSWFLSFSYFPFALPVDLFACRETYGLGSIDSPTTQPGTLDRLDNSLSLHILISKRLNHIFCLLGLLWVKWINILTTLNEQDEVKSR